MYILKILECTEVKNYIITIEDKGEHITFRRISTDNWEQLMGQSWEPVYFIIHDLEKTYKEYVDNRDMK